MLLTAFAVTELLRGVPAEVASVDLENLVRISDVIVIGQVRNVREVRYQRAESGEEQPVRRYPDPLPIADVSVLKVLKGPTDVDRLLYPAARTWECDETEAVPGETALFFFVDTQPPEERRGTLADELAIAFGTTRLYTVNWSGCGRMPLRQIDGRDYATYYTDIVMPEELPNVDGPNPEYASFIRSAPLEELSSRIARFVEEQKRPWVEITSDAGDDGLTAFSLEIRGDRRSVLRLASGSDVIELDLDSGPTLFLTYAFECPAWAFGAEAAASASLPRWLDSAELGNSRGELLVHQGDQVHRIPIEPKGELPAMEYHSLVRAWSELREIVRQYSLGPGK